MKTIILAIILLISGISYALHIECVGNAILIDNAGDTLLVFANNPEVKTLSTVGPTDWYHLSDTIVPVQTGTDYFYPEHGEGYMVKVGNERDVFWVFDYEKLRPSIEQINVELTCETALLHLIGEIPQLTYTSQYGNVMTYPRLCKVEFTSAMWDNEAEMWIDSAAVEELIFENDMIVSSSPVPTDNSVGFSIIDKFAEDLSVEIDTMHSLQYEPVALKAYPMAITTTRGKQSETSNEVNRPYSPDDRMNMSAPLEVLFKSNGLNADYYQWKIYQGSALLFTRNDAEHRYTFLEKGQYRAVVVVSNSDCQLDSVSFDISISESMLLVPNVFTPNGDGANDEFRVAYRSLKEFQCWVYNRWGHLVYKWNDPAKGWDGTINGRPAAEGAYFYVIRALGTDADVNAKYTIKPVYSAKVKKQDESLIGVYQMSGSINLLRGGK